MDYKELCKDLRETCDLCGDCLHCKELDDMMENAADDVAPVVHGRWEEIPNRYVCVAGDKPYSGHATSCSVCHEVNPCSLKTNYCSCCGALMDGKDDDNASDNKRN